VDGNFCSTRISRIFLWFPQAGSCCFLLVFLFFVQLSHIARCECMTPALRELHWLPIRRQITFKTAVLAYKCQHGVAPQYLQSYCESTSTCTGRRHLRSSQMRQLVVRRTRTKYSDCSFAVQGPRVWNSLPVELRAPDISQTVFRNKLKTYLFDIT